MNIRFSRRRKRTNLLIHVITALAVGTIHCPAIAEDVGAYINRNGGCLVFGSSWEREFQRKDDIRYGKVFNDWNARDYKDLKSSILRCLDPWIAAPGRVEVFMRNVDLRLRAFDENRIRQNEITASRQAVEARFQEQQRQIVALDGQFKALSEVARAAATKFDPAAASYLANFKLGTDLSQLDVYEVEGKNVELLLLEAKRTISAVRAVSVELEQKGGPRRFTPDPEQARAVSERLKRIATVRAAKDRCLPILEQAGISRDFASTPILAGSGADDPFVFEVICPASSDALQLIKPGLLSNLYKLNIGRVVTATLWFELRQNPNRLVLKRLRTKAADASAEADWESMNLMNGALVMLMIR